MTVITYLLHNLLNKWYTIYHVQIPQYANFNTWLVHNSHNYASYSWFKYTFCDSLSKHTPFPFIIHRYSTFHFTQLPSHHSNNINLVTFVLMQVVACSLSLIIYTHTYIYHCLYHLNVIKTILFEQLTKCQQK